MPSINKDLFNPCSSKHHAIKEFKDLNFTKKSLTIAITIFASVLTLGFGTTACFRTLVNRFKKVIPVGNEEIEKVNEIATKKIPPEKTSEIKIQKALEEPKIPLDDKTLVTSETVLIPHRVENQKPNAPHQDSTLLEKNLITPIKTVEQSPINKGTQVALKCYPEVDVPSQFKADLESKLMQHSNCGVFILMKIGARLDHVGLPNLLADFQKDNKNLVLVLIKSEAETTSDKDLQNSIEGFFKDFANISFSDPQIPTKFIIGSLKTILDNSGMGRPPVKEIVDSSKLINDIQNAVKEISS